MNQVTSVCSQISQVNLCSAVGKTHHRLSQNKGWSSTPVFYRTDHISAGLETHIRNLHTVTKNIAMKGIIPETGEPLSGLVHSRGAINL